MKLIMDSLSQPGVSPALFLVALLLALCRTASGAASFIDSLKDGYETMLGRQFEDGTELSIGEWQKLALARTFMRSAQILVLDEPTSSLDPSAEEQVFIKFRELARGRTAIIISHRLSTVRSANCIFFMKSGRITERGTHEELPWQRTASMPGSSGSRPGITNSIRPLREPTSLSL